MLKKLFLFNSFVLFPVNFLLSEHFLRPRILNPYIATLIICFSLGFLLLKSPWSFYASGEKRQKPEFFIFTLFQASVLIYLLKTYQGVVMGDLTVQILNNFGELIAACAFLISFLSLLGKYFRANRYGIPFSMTKFSITDTGDTFLEFLVILITGVLFPIAMLSFEMNPLMRLFFAASGTPFIMAGVYIALGHIFNIREKAALILSCIAAVIIGGGYAFVDVGDPDTWAGAIVAIHFFVSVVFVFILFVSQITGKQITRKLRKVITVQTEGGLFMVCMKAHNGKWIILKVKEKENKLYYTKGEFYIRDIDHKMEYKSYAEIAEDPESEIKQTV